MSHDQSPAKQIAHRLTQRHRSERADADRAARAAAACDTLYRGLSLWVGPDGCHALFMRALGQSRSEHPVLEQLQLRPGSEIYVEGVAESAIEHGDRATAEALESMLVRLVELLGRLIGDDMAAKLIERTLPATDGDDETSSQRQEEA